MEVVIIILALVFSVWSEINKKKQEENVDVDFSELSSLDDFFKKPAGTSSATSTASSSVNKAGKKHVGKKTATGTAAKATASGARDAKRQKKADINYDELPALSSRNYDREAAKAEVNYDKLPALSGQVNFESNEDAELEQYPDQDTSSESVNFSFKRNDLLKSFIMSEVLQRYNIERIYDRIPGIKSDN